MGGKMILPVIILLTVTVSLALWTGQTNSKTLQNQTIGQISITTLIQEPTTGTETLVITFTQTTYTLGPIPTTTSPQPLTWEMLR
jgi:regulatory protein YycH of two-component signal transduction system YycFG